MTERELVNIILKKQLVIDKLLMKLKAQNICDSIYDLVEDK